MRVRLDVFSTAKHSNRSLLLQLTKLVLKHRRRNKASQMSIIWRSDESTAHPRRTRGTRYGLECHLFNVVALFVTASIARAAVLENVSPLEMLASVMGPPIAMPSTMGGALEMYLVAGLPWVSMPAGATSSPTRRTVTFLPVESGQPMCTVDVRRPAASCVSIADVSLIPVLAGVETSVVDPDAPLLIVSRTTLALVARNGSTLASRIMADIPFRNLTQFGAVWHVDFNASAAEVRVYHHTATALFVDIVNVDFSNATFGNATVRLHYFTSSWKLVNLIALQYRERPVPSQLLVTIPCLSESTSGMHVSASFLLRSAAVGKETSTGGCIFTIPDQLPSTLTGSCPTAARPTGICMAGDNSAVDFPVVTGDGSVAARPRSNFHGDGKCDKYLASTTAPSTFSVSTSKGYSYPLFTWHSPSQLFDGSSDCADGRAMIMDVSEVYRLTTDFNRRAPLLPDAQHGLGKIFAIVPLTCGSSQVLVLRKSAMSVVNAAVIDFVPPSSSGHSVSLVANSGSLFIKSAPPSEAPVVAACGAAGGCSVVDLKSFSVTPGGVAIGGDIAYGDDTSLAISTTGKGLFDGDIITSQGVPEVIVAVLFLPPLRMFIAVGTSNAPGTVHRICTIQPGAVTCSPVPSVATVREWVWLPPLSDKGGTHENIADVLIVGGNATLPMLFCYIRFTGTVDTVITQQLVAPCRPLPIPAVVTPRQPRMIMHPWLPGIVECAAANATHVHVMLFNYSDEVAMSEADELPMPGAITVQGEDKAIAALDAKAAVTVVVRQFIAGALIGLVPLPIGTTLMLMANGTMDLTVPGIVAPYVPTASAVTDTRWCSSYGSGDTTTISCVDLRTYDLYMVRCEAVAASRNALVYRGKPFSCQVYLAPFATAPAPITTASRQLLYNVSADGVVVTVSGPRLEFRGTVDLDFSAASFTVSYCVRPSNLWSCYQAKVDVANIEDLRMPWNSSEADRVNEPGPATTTNAPPSKLSPTTVPKLPTTTATSASLSNLSETTSELERTTPAPPPTTSIVTTRVVNVLDALPPLASGTDAPISSVGSNTTLSSGFLAAEVFRPASPSSGTLRLVPTNRSANFTMAAVSAHVTIELTLSQPGIGAFVLDAAANGPVTISRDAAQGLFTVSGPAGAVRDALPWLRFGFSPSAAGRNDTTVTVALTADGGPRQTMVVRVSDVAEINTAPKAIGVTPPATLVFAGRAFVALLPTTILDADVRNESLWWSASLEGGAPLPDWMVFDPVAASVTGAVPVAAAASDMAIRLTATDVFGLSASTVATLKIDRAVLASASPRLPDMRVKPGQQYGAAVPRDFVQRRSALSGDVLGPAELTRCSAWTLLTSQEAEWLRAVLSGGGTLLSVGGAVPTSLPLGNVAMELRCYDDGIFGAVRLPFTLIVANAAPRVVLGTVASMLVMSGSTGALSLRDAFVDDDDGELDLRAVRAGGAPLPPWVTFDAIVGVLHCAPEASAAGTSLSVAVTASDGRSSVSLTVTVTVPSLVPPLPLANASGTVIRVEVGTALSEYLSPRRFFANGTAIVRQSLAWPDRPSLDDPDLPVWLRFGDNILSGTASRVGNVTLLLTGTDHTGASATIPLRLEVYDTLLSIVLAWISYIGGFAGAVQAVAPLLLSYHLFFNVLFYGCVYMKTSPLNGGGQVGSAGRGRKGATARLYHYRAKHPTAADVRGYVRRRLGELPLPWTVVGGAVKLFSRYAYDLVTLHEMDNGDPAPPWLTIGHGDLSFSGAPLGDGEPDSVCVHITDSQGRLLEVFDVTYSPPYDDDAAVTNPVGGGRNGVSGAEGTALLVEPLLPRPTTHKDRADGRGGGTPPPPANPLGRTGRPP